MGWQDCPVPAEPAEGFSKSRATECGLQTVWACPHLLGTPMTEKDWLAQPGVAPWIECCPVD